MPVVYGKYNKKNQKNVMNIISSLISAIIIIALVYYFINGLIDSFKNRDYYTNNLQVSRATIQEKDSSDKDLVRVEVPGMDINPDDLWIEVSPDFYLKHNLDDQVGILLGTYDVYVVKTNSTGSGKTYTKTFDKTVWGIEEIYDSYEAAQKANPIQKFNMITTVKEKKTNKRGSHYFMLDIEGKTVKTPVNNEIYDKYNINDKIEGQFESIGDYVKFIDIKNG